MSSISNSFCIATIEDGVTMHGNLSADKSLTQSWNGLSCVPDWKTDTERQPVIKLTLLYGNQLVQPSEGYKWYYNGTEITFDPTTNKSLSPVADVFLKTTENVTYGGTTLAMPALKIIDNLASSVNVDVDMISFSGSYLINGSGVDFSAATQVRISFLTPGSSIGLINFHNGVSDITEKGQSIVAFGELVNSDGKGADVYTTKWWINDVVGEGVAGTTIEGHANAFRVSESDIVDHAILICKFYKGSTLAYTAYGKIDDMQDSVMLYFYYNGNAAAKTSYMRKNENFAEFKIWVGTKEDERVLTDNLDRPLYPTIKIKLKDGKGFWMGGDDDPTVPKRNNSYTGTTKGGQQYGMLPAVDTIDGAYDSQGWRTLPLQAIGSDDANKAIICPSWDTVHIAAKRSLNITVIAYTRE